MVTVNGRPAFQLVPLDENDDLIERLLEHHLGFRRCFSGGYASRVLPVAEVERRLGPSRRRQTAPRQATTRTAVK